MKKEQLTPTETLVNTILDEQGILETLRTNIQELRKQDNNGLNIIEYNRMIKTPSGDIRPIREYLGENFWCILVLLYGEYGYTLRSGWITEKQAFFTMLRYKGDDTGEYEVTDKEKHFHKYNEPLYYKIIQIVSNEPHIHYHKLVNELNQPEYKTHIHLKYMHDEAYKEEIHDIVKDLEFHDIINIDYSRSTLTLCDHIVVGTDLFEYLRDKGVI